MKKILSLVIGASMLFTSCDDKLDIIPKGDTTLDTVDDIETLLNQDFTISGGRYWDSYELVCGTSLPPYTTVDKIFSNKNSINYALFTCDASIDRANLVPTDDRYQNLYEYIKIVNVVASKVESATGDSSKKARINAEARVLRAYFHFLLVNTFAKQYDEATANQLGGIAYVDNTDLMAEKKKLTIAEVYDKMLNDCTDDIIENLGVKATADPCRIGKDFGYGVRARVLFQMKRYDEALKYANLAMSINGKIEDREANTSTGSWVMDEFSPNNYLFIGTNKAFSTFEGLCLMPDVYALIEEGDYLNVCKVWSIDDSSGITGSASGGAYDAQVNTFGLRAEQMYYIAAESNIRLGNIKQGLMLVDNVRSKRIASDKYVSFASKADGLNEAQAMKMLQDAKRIEMLATYENFFDIKRWNSEPNYARTITRVTEDYGTFTLTPDSPIWVSPFPQNVTNFNKTMTQNF